MHFYPHSFCWPETQDFSKKPKVSARTLVTSEGSTERVHIFKFTQSIVGRTHLLTPRASQLIPRLVSSLDSHLLQLRPIRPDLASVITVVLGYSTLLLHLSPKRMTARPPNNIDSCLLQRNHTPQSLHLKTVV